MVEGRDLLDIKETIEGRLADGYMKYPVVSVTLRESRSKKFFVYGEVARPGSYTLDENVTALKAICMAGGFNKFGSSSNVKILRPKTGTSGYETIKVNIQKVMSGKASQDLELNDGDIVVIQEGMF